MVGLQPRQSVESGQGKRGPVAASFYARLPLRHLSCGPSSQEFLRRLHQASAEVEEVRFPRRKSRRRLLPSASFVEINHQLSWLGADRHHVRLMLPQSSPNSGATQSPLGQLGAIHTIESTRRLCRPGRIGAGHHPEGDSLLSRRGAGRRRSWSVISSPCPRRHGSRPPEACRVGVDCGLRHLVTLDEAADRTDRRRRPRGQSGPCLPVTSGACPASTGR